MNETSLVLRGATWELIFELTRTFSIITVIAEEIEFIHGRI